jgi:hypothetical protein
MAKSGSILVHYCTGLCESHADEYNKYKDIFHEGKAIQDTVWNDPQGDLQSGPQTLFLKDREFWHYFALAPSQ